MSEVRVVLESDYEATILGEPGWGIYLAKLGVRLVAVARKLAPHGDTGDLARSVRMVLFKLAGRWRLRLEATNFKAGWHERGTAKMDAHPFLVPATRTVVPSAIIIPGPER